MAKLAKSETKYVYAKGMARGTLTIRIDGELVYQKAPGRDPKNPQPTPEEFKSITDLCLRRAGVDGSIDPEEIEAYDALHTAMKNKLQVSSVSPLCSARATRRVSRRPSSTPGN